MAKEEKLYYQWIKTENLGEIETVDKETTIDGITYYIFESGRQIDKSAIIDFMVELEDPRVPFIDKNNIINENSFSIKHDLDYPTIEELENSRRQDGSFDVGKAETIPHPDDLEKMAEFKKKHAKNNIKTQSKPQNFIQEGNPFLSGIPVENTNIKTKSTSNSAIELINKAKKEEFDLTIKVKVKLPSKHFFNLLDDDYLKKNKFDILKEMINIIKTEDLDTQLQDKLINIYKLKENVQQETEKKNS